jgi:hypothetical protein
MASGFLSSGPGARAAAMGGAFTGLADDVSAMYYNPAGLASQRGALMVEHVPINETGSGFGLGGGGRLNFFAMQYPSRVGTFGFGVIQFSVGDIEARNSLGDEPSKLKVTQTAFLLPYALTLGRFTVGVTGKSVSYNLAGYSGSGIGADAGVKTTLYRGDTFLGRETTATAGVAVRNLVSPTFTLFQDSTALERVTAAGLAVSALMRESYVAAEDRGIYDRFTATLDVSRGNLETPLGVAAGLEYAYLGRFSVRGGYNTTGNVTIGVGAGGPASSVRFDYAAELAALAPQHRFTLSWLFTDPPAAIEGGTRLSTYRRAELDKDRLKERFVREGRAAAAQGRYEESFASFERAQVLDLRDGTVDGLVESSREGSRLTGVKTRLDSSRREHGVRNDAAAARLALEAVAFDPESREAADYAVQLRIDIIKSGTVADFESARRQAVDAESAVFAAAGRDRNVNKMRHVLRRVKALDPDNDAVWRPLEETLADNIVTWSADYVSAAAAAYAAQDAVGMARAVRRLRRADSKHRELRGLEKKLRKVSRGGGGSFYDTNYLRQLYNTAAADYVLGNCESAANNVSVLLRQNAGHVDGNALVNRMRDEGRISDAQEP